MANIITVDMDVLTASLKAASAAYLPWTTLQATSYTLNEPVKPPMDIYTTPAVMASKSFVPTTEYMWRYKDTRQVIIEYIVQRGSSNWQTGRIRIFHDMDLTAAYTLDESKPEPLPAIFVPHSLYVSNTVDVSVGDVGVSIFAAHDARGEMSEERFGITFQITNALPSVFPRMAATYVSVIPVR